MTLFHLPPLSHPPLPTPSGKSTTE
jgi:hypothetical protein